MAPWQGVVHMSDVRCELALVRVARIVPQLVLENSLQAAPEISNGSQCYTPGDELRRDVDGR